MNGKLKKLACLMGVLSGLTFSACGLFPKSTLISAPAEASSLSHTERTEEFANFVTSVNAFSSRFASTIYKAEPNEDEFAVSPISVFMGLSLAAECGEGETQSEILSALGVSLQDLRTHTGTLFRSLTKTHKANGVFGDKTTGMLKPANSIWLDESISVNKTCTQTLAEKYYCYSYLADFMNAPQSAGKAIQKFIKDQTNGQIDEYWHFPPSTAFVLINTLYLKDVWEYDGSNSRLTDKEYTFTCLDGEVEREKFLQRDYVMGRAHEGEKFTSFYTSTYHGYKIKFILPKDGYSLSEVFTEQTLNEVNGVTDYRAEDHENLIRYYTRCLFPTFDADFDNEIRFVLEKEFGIKNMFDRERADFSPLVNGQTWCDGVRHTAELNVDRKGIEGSAVTVIPGAGAPGPDEYEEVYLDYVVDRAFGFVITDSYGVNLFSGIIGEI